MNEVEEKLLLAIEGLLGEVRELQMQNLVQNSGYTALVRHLMAQGFVNAQTLEQDLLCLGETRDDETWRAGHEDFAKMIVLLKNLPSMRDL